MGGPRGQPSEPQGSLYSHAQPARQVWPNLLLQLVWIHGRFLVLVRDLW
jgi:hypothetical protein